jgi:hypothetical protein
LNTKKSVGIAGIIAAVIIAIVLSINFQSEQKNISISPQSNENIGLVINTPSNEITIQQLDRIYQDAAKTGIGRSNVYLFWNLVEPEKGEYNFKDTDILMSLNKKYNLKVTLYFSLINGKTLGSFPTWIGKPSLVSIHEGHLVNILDVMLSRYDIVDTLIIAGEADEYFRYQEDDIEVYKKLFNDVYNSIKEKHPNVKIGNAFSLHGIINKNLDHIVKELDVGDFVAFTYFPVNSLNEIAKTPEEAKKDLEKIFEIVTDSKIAIFEISWSTSDFVGGDRKNQAEFLKNAFNFYKQNKSKIEFFTWFRQYDRPLETCKIDPYPIEGSVSVGGDSGLGSSEFVIERLSHYLCNAGLIDEVGNHKEGWKEFQNQLNTLNS